MTLAPIPERLAGSAREERTRERRPTPSPPPCNGGGGARGVSASRDGGGAWRVSILAFAALALAGCLDLAPAWRRPAEPVPAALPAGPAYPATLGLAPADSVAGWRDFFADPRLTRVIDQALANNRDLRLALANVAIARAQFQAQRASQYPHLDAQAGATLGAEPVSVATGVKGASGSVTTHDYSVGLGVSAWELDLFGRLRNLTRAAQDQYFATRSARDAAQVSLVGAVAQAWLSLAADESLLAIAADTARSGGESLALTQARLTGGVASGLDVAQARTIVEQARFDQARLTTQVAQDRNALELLVGAPVADDLLPHALGPAPVVLARLPAGLTSAVLLRRPDVAEAEDQLRGTFAGIGAARAAFFPNIQLTGSGGLISTALSSLFTAGAATWSFTPSITQPIFDAGANRANLALARAQRDAALASYEKSIQTAFCEVADALAQRGTIDTELAAQRGLADASADTLTLAQARYRSGADTYLNVLIAQRADYAAQQTLVTTRQLEATNLVTLYTALGGGL